MAPIRRREERFNAAFIEPVKRWEKTKVTKDKLCMFLWTPVEDGKPTNRIQVERAPRSAPKQNLPAPLVDVEDEPTPDQADKPRDEEEEDQIATNAAKQNNEGATVADREDETIPADEADAESLSTGKQAKHTAANTEEEEEEEEEEDTFNQPRDGQLDDDPEELEDQQAQQDAQQGGEEEDHEDEEQENEENDEQNLENEDQPENEDEQEDDLDATNVDTEQVEQVTSLKRQRSEEFDGNDDLEED